ncbi:MAG TPA: C-GCAxxG-C-C family protein [Aggregatilineales bacterium]|nr:C_GCAxxG_C_C family protein [Chloroflexota bacterium]HPV07312.1 C-GCAxxG-C-C family protein [Aggregatilineales bacterium]HQA68753.1 C-GCAxxG-C-C family protein [Aggregatilineales bacterium]HQE18325.1 C-GCAxxG-C-C family protein [Aggregatilineales bacterium]
MEELMRMIELQRQGLYCSQILVSMGLQDQDKDNPDLVRAVQALAGGIGFSQDTCGALTGGACLLGLYAGTGPREVDDPRLIQMVQALVDWFREEVGQQYGDTTCKAIVEGNFNNAPSRCPGIVAKTYQKARELLAENGFMEPEL